MAWNRGEAKPVMVERKPRVALHGAIAAAVIVVGAVVAWLVLSRDEPKAARQEEASAPKGLIAEATPAPAPVAVVEPEAPVEKKAEKPVRKSYRHLTPEERERQYEKDLAETPIPANTNRTFRTGLEQVISWVFTVEPGDPPPPPLPPISDFDLVHFEEILDMRNKVKDGDDEATANAKETVDYVKGELKKFVEKGGQPDEFLQYYRDQLQNAYEKRRMAQEQFVEIAQGDPSLATPFLKEVNGRLAEEGIKPVVIPERMQKRLGIRIDAD